MMLSLIKQSWLDPEKTAKKRNALNMIEQGLEFSRNLAAESRYAANTRVQQNPLHAYFDSEHHKPIWKWRHYFDIYQRHLCKFQDECPTLLEIGVYDGGSLEMWQDYFNPGSRIIGIDIDERCRRLAGEYISIHIGDQSDRRFWQQFKMHTSEIDIIVDDGGHKPDQQIITLEECLPLLKPGGVYICEDVHGIDHYFLDYVYGLVKSMNQYNTISEYTVQPGALQKRITGIHIYPFMVVIEMNDAPVDRFVAQKKGARHD